MVKRVPSTWQTNLKQTSHFSITSDNIEINSFRKMIENANDIHFISEKVTNFYPSLVRVTKATNRSDNININTLQ